MYSSFYSCFLHVAREECFSEFEISHPRFLSVDLNSMILDLRLLLHQDTSLHHCKYNISILSPVEEARLFLYSIHSTPIPWDLITSTNYSPSHSGPIAPVIVCDRFMREQAVNNYMMHWV